MLLKDKPARVRDAEHIHFRFLRPWVFAVNHNRAWHRKVNGHFFVEQVKGNAIDLIFHCG